MIAQQKAYECSSLGGVREGCVFDSRPGPFSPPEGFMGDIQTIANEIGDPSSEDCEFEMLAQKPLNSRFLAFRRKTAS
jgi:hypothetical protein